MKALSPAQTHHWGDRAYLRQYHRIGVGFRQNSAILESNCRNGRRPTTDSLRGSRRAGPALEMPTISFDKASSNDVNSWRTSSQFCEGK